jgi:sugar phosphate isomerase/epimerase
MGHKPMIAHTTTPTAHDLDSNDIVLGHFTLGRRYPMHERLAAAADAGVAGVGLFMGDLEHWAAHGLSDDELARSLGEHDLLFVDLDLINLAPRDPVLRERSDRFLERAVQLADRFGYRYLQTIAPTSEPGAAGFGETVDELGRVADALAPFGVEVGLEYTGFTTISTASQAVAAVEACGRANLGVCIDVWHHRRASNHVELTSIDASLVRCVQVNDGPTAPDDPDYKRDCLCNRLAPGTGEMDVAGFVSTLLAMGVDVPWTVEVCRDDSELAGGRGHAHAVRCVEAMRGVLAAVMPRPG